MDDGVSASSLPAAAAAAELFEVAAALIARGQLDDAGQCLDRAAAQASRSRRAPEPRGEYLRARIDRLRGRPDAAARRLCELTQSPGFGPEPLPLRLEILGELGALCRGAMACDAALACCARAARECARAGLPLPALDRLRQALSMIDLSLYAEPMFSDMLLPPSEVPPDSAARALLLSDAARLCEDALARDDGTLQRADREVALLAANWARALGERTRLRCLESADAWLRAGRRDAALAAAWRCRVLAGALVLDELGLAARVRQAGLACRLGRARLPDSPSAAELHWHYLEAKYAECVGDPAEALRLFKAYAITTARLSAMDMVVRQVVLSVDAPAAAPGRPQASAAAAPRRPAFLDRALHLLREAPAWVTIASVAGAVGVSERAMRDAFRQHEGLSPKRLQTAAQLDQARSFILKGRAAGCSVKDIALAHGFSHANRFSQMYRRRFGESPANTRDRMIAQGEPPRG